MQLIREGSAGVGIFTQTVAHHPVDSVVGLKPQHIAQIIMFAVPDQQPLSGSVFPEEGILVLVQRIHTVVAVNIREEELHTVFNHGVTVAHGESIDIGCHGCVNFCAERLQLVLPFGQTLAEYIRIDKIIEVQIVGRNTDFAFLDKTGKVSAVVLTGLFPELLYAVQRFAVPAEVSIFRLTHHGQHGFDIVDLNCNNAFLQIRVAYVRVGMILYGAAFGWNAEPVEFDELNEAVSRLYYGDTTGQFVGLMAKLQDYEVFDWRNTVNWIECDEKTRAEILSEVDFTRIDDANRAVEKAKADILAAAVNLPAGKKQIVQVLCQTADIIVLWNRIGAWLNAGCPHGPEADAMAAALEHWLQRYRAQWRQVSKESSLSVLTNLICRYADLLRGRAYGTVEAPAGR